MAFARHVGPTRVEAELLPQCWEQVNTIEFSPAIIFQFSQMFTSSFSNAIRKMWDTNCAAVSVPLHSDLIVLIPECSGMLLLFILLTNA